MVQADNDKPPAREGLIAEGCASATRAALERLGSEDAVQAEFDRINAKLGAALEGEQNDLTALALHCNLVAVLEEALGKEVVH